MTWSHAVIVLLFYSFILELSQSEWEEKKIESSVFHSQITVQISEDWKSQGHEHQEQRMVGREHQTISTTVQDGDSLRKLKFRPVF